jgi:hypothetical protein
MLKLDLLKTSIQEKNPTLSENEISEIITLIATQFRDEIKALSDGCCNMFPEDILINGFDTPNSEGEYSDWCDRCEKALDEITLLNRYIIPIAVS